MSFENIFLVMVFIALIPLAIMLWVLMYQLIRGEV
jgi:hypothetical protein